MHGIVLHLRDKEQMLGKPFGSQNKSAPQKQRLWGATGNSDHTCGVMAALLAAGDGRDLDFYTAVL